MTIEEILQNVSGSSKYRDIYDKILSTDSLMSTMVMNQIQKENPKSPSDLWPILDRIRGEYRSILGGGPSTDELEVRKAKIFLLMKAALADGSINDQENKALSQMVNAYEYRVPDLDIRAIASQFGQGKAESTLQEASYGDRIRLLNNIDYIFQADGPINEKEKGLMRDLFSQFDIKADAAGNFNFNPARVYGIRLGDDEEPAPQKAAPRANGQGMSREAILETTGRMRDLHVFHDILTSGTPGAERLYEAVADLNISNPMMLTSYLLQNKDELLVYCDDEASRVRIAKTVLLLFAASVDGRSKKKDDMVTDLTDNKIHIYNFEWNQAITWHKKDSEWQVGTAVNILSELSEEERADIFNDVVSIFEADGEELSPLKLQNLGYLKDDLGLDDGSDEEESVEENDNDESSAETEEESVETAQVHQEKEDGESIEPGLAASEVSQKKEDTLSWTCPSCGHTGNKGKFCEECGTKRPEPEGPWTCPSCGHSGNKGKFCEECGTKRPGSADSAKSDTKTEASKPTQKEEVKNKGTKKVETAPKPQATPKPKPNEQTATINSVKVDKDYELDLDKGVLLHVNCDIVNCKGTACVCGAWLFRADGTPVTRGTAKNQVADTDKFTPDNDNTHFDDMQFFIPHSEFYARKKEEKYYVIIQVQTSSGLRLSSGYQEDITLISDVFNNVDPSCFSEIRYEDYDNKELRITAKLADSPNLNRPGELRAWFYHENGHVLWNKKAEPKYKVNGGDISVNRRFVSGSAGLLKSGIGLSIPYAAMGISVSATFPLKFQVGIRFEGEEEGTYSDFVDFTLEVKKGLFSTTYRLVK